MQLTKLALPPHYNPANNTNAGYTPNIVDLMIQAEQWKKQNSLKPAAGDQVKIHVLVIDDQFSFSFPQGELYVAGRSGTGAMDAHRRLTEWVYSYLGAISQLSLTLDSHLPYQIFFPAAHLTDQGNYPAPNTMVLADEYRAGKYRPNPAMARELGADPIWLQKYFNFYCQELERVKKPPLILWNPHCMLGSNGHRLAGVVEEFRFFHSFARGAANLCHVKGGSPFTEHYSIFKPEIMFFHNGDAIPGVQRNTDLMDTLLDADIVVIAGEASSHCVRESIADFLNYILAADAKLARKIYLMRDCMAPVVIPTYDFTDDAEKALQNFADAGMNVVESTTPLEQWPGVAALFN